MAQGSALRKVSVSAEDVEGLDTPHAYTKEGRTGNRSDPGNSVLNASRNLQHQINN